MAPRKKSSKSPAKKRGSGILQDVFSPQSFSVQARQKLERDKLGLAAATVGTLGLGLAAGVGALLHHSATTAPSWTSILGGADDERRTIGRKSLGKLNELPDDVLRNHIAPYLSASHGLKPLPGTQSIIDNIEKATNPGGTVGTNATMQFRARENPGHVSPDVLGHVANTASEMRRMAYSNPMRLSPQQVMARGRLLTDIRSQRAARRVMQDWGLR